VALPARRRRYRRTGRFDTAACRERHRVERPINRPKRWWRIAACYEKRAATYAAMLTVACITV